MLWLRKTVPGDPLTVTMAGVKLADRVLVLGCSDPNLIAHVAIKSGLTGRTCALDESKDRTTRAAVAVEREGALIEAFTAPWTALPFDDGSFDVVLIRDVLPSLDPEPRVRCLQEVMRVLRAGGRSVVIETARRGGLGALFNKVSVNEQYANNGGAERALQAEGFVGARTLAEREGLAFVEAVKPNKPLS